MDFLNEPQVNNKIYFSLCDDEEGKDCCAQVGNCHLCDEVCYGCQNPRGKQRFPWSCADN
mgnify:CR=1 FL=1